MSPACVWELKPLAEAEVRAVQREATLEAVKVVPVEAVRAVPLEEAVVMGRQDRGCSVV